MKNLLRFLALPILAATPAMAGSPHSLYWAPPNVTVGGEKIDVILDFIFWLTLIVFVVTQVIFVYYLVRYRQRPGHKAHYSHGNNKLEIVWTTIPVIIFLALAIYSNRVWSKLHVNPPPDAVMVNVASFQFGWEMRYPGADGVLGHTDVAKISPDNKFGLLPGDEAGKDDFVSSELVIPAGRAVHILLNSRDVIHSFYVPSFRLYQDAVPGRTISWVWFEVKAPGNFELACSQLCGIGHFNMKAPIRVLSQEEYDKWYAEKVKAKSAAALEPATASSPQLANNQPATP